MPKSISAQRTPVTILIILALLALMFYYLGSLRTLNPIYHSPRIKVKNGTSTNWSGYAALTNLSSPQNNSVSDVKGSWVIPTLSCSSINTYSSEWVGIDGYSDSSVEQTGTEGDCINGKSSYYAWYEMYPKISKRTSLVVNAGDTINAEVQYSRRGVFILTLKNQTSGQSFSTSQKNMTAQRTSAEWVMEAPSSGSILPLANFGTIQFSNAQATINGISGTISNGSWQNDPMVMVTSSGTPKASPSSLSADGSSFSVSWFNN